MSSGEADAQPRLPASGVAQDPVAAALLHFQLRFAAGATLSFVLCEYMDWAPAFLPPLFLGLVITSLPSAPPLKVGIMLTAVMAAAAWISYLLTTLLLFSPAVLVGAVGVLLFLALVALARHKAVLPAILLLICLATIPVIGLLAPAQAHVLPTAYTRAMAVAIGTIWLVYAIWPLTLPKAAAPAPTPIESPVRTALGGTLILLPIMMTFLMFGWADALPVLISTVLLVITFDPAEGFRQGVVRSLSVLIGGLIGYISYVLLWIAPNLASLALVTFIVAMWFAIQISKGGPRSMLYVLAFNSTMVILGTAVASPDASSGIWMTRMFQFTFAGLLAVAMMNLVWRKR